MLNCGYSCWSMSDVYCDLHGLFLGLTPVSGEDWFRLVLRFTSLRSKTVRKLRHFNFFNLNLPIAVEICSSQLKTAKVSAWHKRTILYWMFPFFSCSHFLFFFFYQSSSLVCKQTATTLCNVGITSSCLEILKTLLEHWKEVANHEEVCFLFFSSSQAAG